ncbi:hypothetical protein DM860_018016 [Cuscuta australis]|uniref:Uncharacterized protein n=1 Tax=Cuscuta australis TaxID=267555 RepID=A0A328EA60_9ASTE|nr:hypothetical protein DM860_018016 [Cuscuta australis]
MKRLTDTPKSARTWNIILPKTSPKHQTQNPDSKPNVPDSKTIPNSITQPRVYPKPRPKNHGINDNKKEWTCKVRVVEKRNVKDSRTSPNKYRPFLLQGEEGTKVLALENSGDSEQIDKILDLKNTYYISSVAAMPNQVSTSQSYHITVYLAYLLPRVKVGKLLTILPCSHNLSIFVVLPLHDFYSFDNLHNILNFDSFLGRKPPAIHHQPENKPLLFRLPSH